MGHPAGIYLDSAQWNRGVSCGSFPVSAAVAKRVIPWPFQSDKHRFAEMLTSLCDNYLTRSKWIEKWRHGEKTWNEHDISFDESRSRRVDQATNCFQNGLVRKYWEIWYGISDNTNLTRIWKVTLQSTIFTETVLYFINRVKCCISVKTSEISDKSSQVFFCNIKSKTAETLSNLRKNL